MSFLANRNRDAVSLKSPELITGIDQPIPAQEIRQREARYIDRYRPRRTNSLSFRPSMPTRICHIESQAIRNVENPGSLSLQSGILRAEKSTGVTPDRQLDGINQYQMPAKECIGLRRPCCKDLLDSHDFACRQHSLLNSVNTHLCCMGCSDVTQTKRYYSLEDLKELLDARQAEFQAGITEPTQNDSHSFSNAENG
jgi:hypothetical protein